MSPTAKPKVKPKPKAKPVLKMPSIVGEDGSPPTFECVTHAPAHIAHSIAGIINLQITRKCKKFRVVPPPKIMGGH